jgi:non-homologous end joining protein Ku
MNKNKINKASILKSITKMVSDKEAVRSYIKGNTDFKTIENKGIKFARPI